MMISPVSEFLIFRLKELFIILHTGGLKKQFLHLALLLLLFPFTSILNSQSQAYPSDPYLKQWKDFSLSGESEEFKEYLRCQLLRSGCVLPDSLPKISFEHAYFITLVKKNRNRGCFGAFHHRERNFHRLIKRYIRGALREDPRSIPLQRDEFDDVRIYLSIGTQPKPAEKFPDTKKDGIVFHYSENRQEIYIPGEIRGEVSLSKMINSKKPEEIRIFEAFVWQIPFRAQ